MPGWKHLYLSKGGRLTLLKSILSSLPIYYLSLFTIPVAMADKLERIQRNFLWGSLEECFKHSLMAWEKACSPLEIGGLGVRKLVHFNQDLLGKWLWRFGQEGTHLWQRVIATKYGKGQGGWNTKVCRRANGSGLWRGINDSWERFSKHLALVMGDGSRIHFWHDRWVGDTSLKMLYPQLYACSNDKEACISDLLCHQESVNNRFWNLRFYRNSHERELESAFSFLDFIQSRIPRGIGCDSPHWCLNGNGKFDIQSFYNKIKGTSLSSFPWKGIWKAKVPKRVAFFMWTASHGQILTLDNLMLRGLPLANK